MQEKEKELIKTIVISLLLLAFALVSALWLADVVSAPEHHSSSIAALDEKKTTVMELTAAAAAASVVISAVPGDATTPIADQVAEMGSWLLIVTAVLMLEKFLLTFTWFAAFRLLAPFAFACIILYLLVSKPKFKKVMLNLALRAFLLGVVLCTVIPASLRVSELFEETFEFQQTVQKAEQTPEALEGEGDTEADEGAESGGIGDWFAGLGDTITSGVSGAVEKAEAALSDFIDAVAVLLISNCVIPVLVLMLMLWVLKMAVSLPIGSLGPMGGGPRPPALPEHKAKKPQT